MRYASQYCFKMMDGARIAQRHKSGTAMNFFLSGDTPKKPSFDFRKANKQLIKELVFINYCDF